MVFGKWRGEDWKDIFLKGFKIAIFFAVLFLVVIFGYSAVDSGKSCIEANDFGEYALLEAIVPSRLKTCLWEEKSGSDGNGDLTIQRCLEENSGNKTITAVSDNNCSITVRTSYSKLKEASKGATTDKFLSDNFIFTNCGSAKETKIKFIREAYDKAVEICVSACETRVGLAYEPSWIKLNDVPISFGNKIKMSVSGNIKLQTDVERVVEFNDREYTIQRIPSKLDNTSNTDRLKSLIIQSSTTFLVKGNAENDGATENIINRQNFLRRGVIILQDIPSVFVDGVKVVGSLDSNGKYVGPDISINPDNIKCIYRENNFNKTECNYEDTKSSDPKIRNANNILFKLDDYLVKKNAGLVIPKDVNINNDMLNYIAKYPFTDYFCGVRQDNYKVYRSNCSNLNLSQQYSFDTATKAFVFRNNNEYNFRDEVATEAGVVTYKGDDYSQVIKNIRYPVKVMARIIGGADPNKSCTLLVKIPDNMRLGNLDYTESNEYVFDSSGRHSSTMISNQYLKLEVKADDKWYYVVDNTGNKNHVIFGHTNTHALRESSEGRLNKTSTIAYDLNFKVLPFEYKSTTFNESSGITPSPNDLGFFRASKSYDNGNYSRDTVDTPCGVNMAVMLMPQNEIMVGESGLVHLKNPLLKSGSGCLSNETGCVDGSGGKEIFYPFSLINSKILRVERIRDLASADTIFDIKAENFFDRRVCSFFKEDDNTITVNDCDAPQQTGDIRRKFISPNYNASTTPKFALSKSNSTSQAVFVRKGQTIRFDENSWFLIEGNQTGGYTVKEKVFRAKNDNDDPGVLKSVGDGLVMYIEKRPALLCNGKRSEVVSNSQCKQVEIVRDGGRQIVCMKPYSQYCNDRTNGFERYCPLGCVTFISNDGQAETNAEYNKQGDYSKYGGGYGALKGSGDNAYQAYYVDEYDRQMDICTRNVVDGKDYSEAMGITLGKCQKCRSYLIDSKADEFASNGSLLELDQCYDLEDYAGSLDVLKSMGPTYTLSVMEDMGLSKLGSIFSTEKSYGNLEGSIVDMSKKSGDGLFSEFVYKTPELSVQEDKLFNFLVLNKDRDEDFSNLTSAASNGFYKITISNGTLYKNGEQLQLFVAHRDWNGAGENVQRCRYSDGSEFLCVKKKVLSYDDNGQLNEGGGYKIEPTTGLLTNTTTRVTEFEFGDFFDSVGTSVTPVKEEHYDELKIFLKIKDVDERAPNKCGNDTKKVAKISYKYRCSASENYRDLKNISCTDNAGGKSTRIEGACPGSGNTCKKSEGSYVYPTDRKEDVECVSDMYYNNDGFYTAKIKVLKNFRERTTNIGNNGQSSNFVANLATNATGFSVSRILVPLQEVMEGKTAGIASYIDDGGYRRLVPCGNDAGSGVPTQKCIIYDTNRDRLSSVTNKGVVLLNKGCYASSDAIANGTNNCYLLCQYLTTEQINEGKKCLKVSDNNGFIKLFYNKVINDIKFHVILNSLLTLMLAFYGGGQLLGLSEISNKEALKKAVRISIIYLFLSPDVGWYYYNQFFIGFFKSAVDYLVYAVASAFEADFESGFIKAMLIEDYFDKSILFSSTDRNISLVLSAEVNWKILGMLFNGVIGWLYVLMMYFSIWNYVFACAYAVMTYIIADFFMNLFLSFGPIIFVFLVFERTKSFFDAWIKLLCSFLVQAIGLVLCLSLFNTVAYNVIKQALYYRVCWGPVWIMNLPLVGSLQLLDFWKIASSRSQDPSQILNLPGLFTVMIVYCFAELMKSLMDIVINFGKIIAGSKGTGDSLKSSGLRSPLDDMHKKVADAAENNLTAGAEHMVGELGKKVGYKTESDEMKEKDEDKKAVKAHRDAVRKGREAREKLAAEGNVNADELDEGYKNAYKKSFMSDMGFGDEKKKKAFLERHNLKEDELHKQGSKGLTSSNNLLSKHVGYAATSDSLLGAAGSAIWSRISDKITGTDASENADSTSKKSVGRMHMAIAEDQREKSKQEEIKERAKARAEGRPNKDTTKARKSSIDSSEKRFSDLSRKMSEASGKRKSKKESESQARRMLDENKKQKSEGFTINDGQDRKVNYETAVDHEFNKSQTVQGIADKYGVGKDSSATAEQRAQVLRNATDEDRKKLREEREKAKITVDNNFISESIKNGNEQDSE
ncbi:MAG: type IV secretion system protein [Rickettsiales bacterium]|jgi:type IV secretory pathway VirB6-like protein|nr:type IV secretion system protein [Rickettsiales bacterium]